MPKPSIKIDPRQPLDELEAVGFQLSWQRPISYRLDQLVERARRARTDRSEVAAAILCARDYTAEELEELVLKHRARRARDVVLDVEPTATVIELPRHGAGRRRRSA